MSQMERDCVVIGGGVIGLSIAWELVKTGQRVAVLNRQTTPHIASWAAGGILPPPVARALHDPLEQLRAFSHRLYREWQRELMNGSEIELEFGTVGGVYLGRTAGERIALRSSLDQWEQDGLHVESWDAQRLRDCEPMLSPMSPETAIYFLRDELLVRPPRILKALQHQLRRSGVTMVTSDQVHWQGIDDESVELDLGTQRLRTTHVCIAAGPWSASLVQPLGIVLPVEPRRGQMVLWKFPQTVLQHVVNEGPRYLIARPDGHLLAGSTVEEVGFDGRTTEVAIAQLRDFAASLLPAVGDHGPVAAWAGLRPWSVDGLPYLGRVPGYPAISLATGHFRSGIHLAPATGKLMCQLICGEAPDLSLAPFAVDR